MVSAPPSERTLFSWLHPSHRAPLGKTLISLALLFAGALLITFLKLQNFLHAVGYLPLYILIEATATTIAIMVFVVGWHGSKRGLPTGVLLLACTYLGVAVLNVSHLMSHAGMPDFISPSGPQKANAFGLSSHFMAAAGLLVYAIRSWPAFPWPNVRYLLVGAVSSLLLFLHWLFLFHLELIPLTYIPGQGLTAFKIGCEGVIVVLNLITALLLLQRMRTAGHELETAGLLGAVCALAIGETFFSFYDDVDDLYMLLGHYFKIASYLYLYRAIFVTTIDRPYTQLQISQNKLKATLDAVPDLILEVDMNGCCYECHTSSPPLLASIADTSGIRALKDIMPPEAIEIGFDALREAHQHGHSKGKQLAMELPDGNHWFELSVSSKPVMPGRTPRYIVVARDITRRKQTELELQTLNAELEKRVLARTHALEQAKVLADSAYTARSAFLANMSHEIRTPINSILGMSHLASTVATDAKLRKYLDNIQASGEHLLAIIDDILNYSKISAGKFTLERTDFQLSELVSRMKSMFKEKALAKGLKLVFEVDAALPDRFYGDPVKLHQILINLIGNALKFTERGHITLRINRVRNEAEQYWLRFEVTDTGIGISEDNASKLFQPFQQGDARATRQYGGTGLGLTISKHLVEMMPAGKIGVTSLPGKGSTFWFEVSLEKCEPRAPAKKSRKPKSTPQLPLHGARILLVDNNVFNQQVATEMLEHAGAVVCLAQNGKEAVDLANKENFDCVLMDLQMPEMDGWEATRLILGNPRHTNLPIIALTANTSSEDRRLCLAAGMVDFLSKPFMPESFYETIAKHLVTQPQQLSMFDAPATAPSAAATSAQPDIDLSVLAELVGGHQEKVQEFVWMFWSLAIQDVGLMEAAAEHGNRETLQALAHHNRSPALMVGAYSLADLCARLETLSKSESGLEAARAIVKQMRPLLDRIQQHFQLQPENSKQHS
jgi:signal transduction histidine kinase/DNA-binding response OmpR family regulator